MLLLLLLRDFEFQTGWPTLVYGLQEVGLNPRGVQRFHGFVMRHLRILARSPRGADCETNISLLSRLKIIDPFDKLCLGVYKIWKRREYLAVASPSSDIMGCYVSLCRGAVDCKHLLWQWFSIVLEHTCGELS